MVMANMAKVTFTRATKERALLRLDAGCTVRDVSRQHGVSVRTLYRWRASGVRKQQVTDGGERLRLLELKYRRLQKQFAELVLDYVTLRVALMKDVKGDC